MLAAQAWAAATGTTAMMVLGSSELLFERGVGVLGSSELLFERGVGVLMELAIA